MLLGSLGIVRSADVGCIVAVVVVVVVGGRVNLTAHVAEGRHVCCYCRTNVGVVGVFLVLFDSWCGLGKMLRVLNWLTEDL